MLFFAGVHALLFGVGVRFRWRSLHLRKTVEQRSSDGERSATAHAPTRFRPPLPPPAQRRSQVRR